MVCWSVKEGECWSGLIVGVLDGVLRWGDAVMLGVWCGYCWVICVWSAGVRGVGACYGVVFWWGIGVGCMFIGPLG